MVTQQMAMFFFATFLICPGFANELPDYATTEEALKSAYACVELPTSDKMESWIHANYPTANIETPEAQTVLNLRGLSFKNQSAGLVRAFLALTKETDLVQRFWDYEKSLATAANRPIDTTKRPHVENLRRYSDAVSQCQTILCASKIIWGDPAGVKILWSYLRLGLNLSHFQQRGSDKLSNGDIDIVLHSYLLFDPEIRDRLNSKGTGFFSISRPLTTQLATYQKKTLANSLGQLFPRYFEEQPLRRFGHITHELGHRLANDTVSNPQGLQTWSDLISHNKECKENLGCLQEQLKNLIEAPSAYARTSIVEDLAESLAAYRINPDKIKGTSRYNYIKNHYFNGQEFEKDLCAGVEAEFRMSTHINPMAPSPSVKE